VAASDPGLVAEVAAALTGIRGAKTAAKASMRAELSRVELIGPAATLAAIQKAVDDLRKAGRVVGEIVFTTTEDDAELTVEAELVAEG